ncbi:hypothetical protein V1520DRAFT_284033 [Lipomyces starkeyi]
MHQRLLNPPQLQLGLLLAVVLISALNISAATTAASTAFPVPSIITPHFDTDPSYEVLPPAKTGFVVAYVDDWGHLMDWSRSPRISTERQGIATFCSIQNRGFWFFGNTSTQDTVSQYTRFFSSSISLAKDFGHPGWIVDDYAEWPSIPRSPEETEFEDIYGMTFAAIPHTHCAVIAPSKAIQFWDMRLDICGGQTDGTSLVIYEFFPAFNVLKVTRPTMISLTPHEYRYGSFATVVVKGVVYLYALEISGSGAYQDVHVASAPSATIEDKSTWRYWDQGAGTWSPVEPLPTSRRQSAAVISLPPGIYFNDGGSVFYSEYHNSYLLFFLTQDYVNLRVKYSPTPLGPWSTNDQIVYTFPLQISTALVTPVPFQSGTAIAGQTLLVTWIAANTFVTSVKKLTFA